MDLGTAYARAAVPTDHGPRLLQLEDGSPALPAVVAYTSGSVRVGHAAVEKAAMHPGSSVRGVKRILGRAADDPVVVSIAAYASYGVAARAGGGLSLSVDGELREPEDVAAAILAHLADAAAALTGARPGAAVLTAPHHAGGRQRRALAEAARRAGLASAQIMSEGTAIALSLAGVERAQRRVAIADVGAGGIAVSVAETGPARVVLLGCAGEPAGGGDDIDRGLLAAVLEDLHGRWGDFPDPPAIHEMLRQTCEAMKRDLDELAEVRAVIPFLPVGRRGLRNAEIRVARARFEAILDDTRARVEAAARAALGQAQISPTELAGVYAAGGLAQVPGVRAAVERALGRITSRHHDPEGAAALGAAIHASMLEGAIEAIPIVDVQPGAAPSPSIPPVSVRTPPPSIRRASAPPSCASAPPPRTGAPPGPEPQATEELRLEVASLLASVRAGAVTDAGGGKPAQRIVRVNETLDADDLVDPERRAEVTQRLHGIWNQLGLALLSARQYRWDHPLTVRHVEAALHEIERAVEAAPRSVRFEVAPTCFAHDGEAVWKPDRAPLDCVPRQLFADGLRAVQWKPGLCAGELQAFLGVLLEAASGFATDEDAVTALWDRRLTRIVHLAVDACVEAEAALFERDREDLVVELTRACDVDLEGTVGSVAAGRREEVDHAVAAALPEAALRELSARAEVGPEVYAARGLGAFPEAYREAERHGDVELLRAALQGFVEGRVAAGDPDALFGTLARLADAFEAHEGVAAAAAAERELTRAMLPPGLLAGLFQRLGEAPVTPGTARALSRALSLAGDPASYDAARAAYWAGPGALREALLPYLLEAGAGHEGALGKLVRDGDVAHALAALGRLAEIGTAPARAAIHEAFASAHVELRIAAVTHLPEAAAETVRAELTKLLEDPEPAVRLRVLSVIGELHAVAAGPLLVRRVHDGALGKLPVPERRLLLQTLAQLSPRRAEVIAVELLGETHLIPSHALDDTRVIAAEVLGAVGGPDALDALRQTARRRWLNTAAVRDAAAAAAQAVAARLGVPPEART